MTPAEERHHGPRRFFRLWCSGSCPIFCATSSGICPSQVGFCCLAIGDTTMWQAHPWMMEGAHARDSSRTVFANWSKVDVRGAGVGVRGLHSDLIVGDDVLSDENTRTSASRRQVERWWSGTVGPMAHPGVERTIGSGSRQDTVSLPPTRIHLVGMPFFGSDLLMSLRSNPIYEWRRYAAEFEKHDLVPGTWAVEAA